MKGLWKIVKIILVFFTALFAISFIWYIIEIGHLAKGETEIPFIDYVLYLLGFGDLNLKDHYLQTGFSTLGLFAVTLLSSVFTVNLFELRSKVKIDSRIIIKSVRSAKLKLIAKKKDIYNLTATLISKCGNELTVEEQKFPFVAKGTSQEVIYKIDPGTAIYKYLRSVYLNPDDGAQLIMTIVYTDIESGQEYTMAQKFQYSVKEKKEIIFSGDDGEKHSDAFEKAVRERIEKNSFPLNLESVFPCNAEDIDIIYGYKDDKMQLPRDKAICASVHMNSNKTYESDTFTMAVTKDLLDNDWRKYYDLDCMLKFDYKIDEDISVVMQFKCGDKNEIKKEHKLCCCDTFETFSFSLQELNRDDLEFVSELCFTVFYKHVNKENPIGNFVIKNCELEVRKEEL